MVLNTSHSCHDNINSGVVMATKCPVADDTTETEMKPKLTKSVRFAPDVKFRNEQEPLRLSHVKRTPSGSLFNLNVLLQQTDQLPAVVEKYMIRSLPETSSVQDPTANIIYIDSVGMRYKNSEKDRDHSVSHSHSTREQLLSHAQPPPQASNRDTPKGFMNSKTPSEKAKFSPGQKHISGRELSSNQTVLIRASQAKSNQCQGREDHTVETAAIQSAGKKAHPPTSSGSTSTPHGQKQYSKSSPSNSRRDNPKTNMPKTSKYGPKLSRSHGSTSVNKSAGYSKDIKHSTK